MTTRLCLGPVIGRPCPTGSLIPRGNRCPSCQRARWAAKGTTAGRGYGGEHRKARAELAATLPAPCGYCQVTVHPGDQWAAAHVMDGDPSFGWIVAHRACNERAKRR